MFPSQIEISESSTEVMIEVTLEVEIVSEVVDGPPQFAQLRYSFSIREDDEDGTELGDLRASDDGQFYHRYTAPIQ